MVRSSGLTIKPFSASTSSHKPASRPRQKAEEGEAYTFIPSLPKRHRTSEQTLSLSREEAGPSRRRRPQQSEANGDGDGDDSDNDMSARVRKLAMLIAQDDLAELDDSESSVASDDAWEEEGSDEERWGEVFRDLKKGKEKGKPKRKVEVVREAAIPLNVDLDESDDEPVSKKGKGKAKAKVAPVPSALKQAVSAEEGSDNEVLSDDEEEESGLDSNLDEADLSPNEFEGGRDGDDDSAGDEDEEEEDEEDDEGDDDDDEDQDEDEDLAVPSDLSNDDMEDPDPTSLDGLDAFVDRLTESSKRDAPDQERVKKRRVLDSIPAPALDGNDLGLKSRTKIDLSSLIASHPSLSSASALLPKTTKSKPTSILKQGTLPAPLPTSVQDRLNREAAYEATKEEGAKWAGVMKRIKEAEHLSFPLQADQRGGVKSSGEVLSTYKPRAGLESAVQTLLAKANLTEDGVTKRENEALEGQELSLEEIEERRKRLREQRELMFRAEARSKRVAKIKSKTFRKLARKRAAKAGEDVDDGDVDAEERREKAEMERAKERATLKHGARTSRWARHGGVDEEGRMAKEEMLDIKQRLSKRIQGDDSGSDGSEESEDEEGDEDVIKGKAFDQLAKGVEPDTGREEGLMGMAFMKKARERQRQKGVEEEQGVKRDIEMFGDPDDGDESEEEEGAMMNIGGTGGRMVFSGPAGKTSRPPTGTSRPAEVPTNGQTPESKALHFNTNLESPSEINPWLAQPSSTGPSRKRQHGLTSESSAADKAVKSLKKAGRDPTAQEEDGRVEITLDPENILGKGSSGNRRNGVNGNGDEGDEEDAGMGSMPRKRVKLGQRDLIAEAFAGDNVVEDFEAEKARIVAEDAPHVEDTTLPGWGSWSGKGLKKRKPNPNRLVTKPGIDPSTRADAKRANVIISEKKDKKAAKYLVKDLPYPYTSKAQYEKRFDNPLGAEWNSRGGHQRETLPRVMKKPGAIIEPVRRLF